ncbi:MAG: zinc ribbon domain-containing protein [Candidatus Heimdallarchaeota archaeon]|nr:MAG: zinc ribbon domain-containing protein [Candidatus Heimdallarchaeota archaeon]
MKKRALIFILFSIPFLSFLPTTCNPLIERTTIFICNFDAYIFSSNPNINYGDTLDLKVSSNSSTSTLHYSYLAFRVRDLPFPGEVLRVILNLNITSIITDNHSFNFRVWQTFSFEEKLINWENKPNINEETLVSEGTITEPGRYECSLSAAHNVRDNGKFYFRLDSFNNDGEIQLASRENGYYSSSRLEITSETLADPQYIYSDSSDNFIFLGLGMIGILFFFGIIAIVGIFLTISLRSQRRRFMEQYEPRYPNQMAKPLNRRNEISFCFNCGRRISPNEIFCSNCGVKII